MLCNWVLVLEVGHVLTAYILSALWKKITSTSPPLEPMSWAQCLDAKTHMVTELAGFHCPHIALKADLQLSLEIPSQKGSKAPRCFKREWPHRKTSHVKVALSALCTFPSAKTTEILRFSGPKPLSGFPMALAGQAESQDYLCLWDRPEPIPGEAHIAWM